MRDQRIAFVAAATRPGANRRALCREFGISPTTGYKWIARVGTDGLSSGLRDRSRRPHQSPDRISATQEAEIVKLRLAFGWAGRKLQPLLAPALRCSVSTIDRVIRRHGLTDADEAHRPAPRRFTAEAPNVRWQMDFKGQYPTPAGAVFPLSVLDDHSRFAIALAPLTGTAATSVQAVLIRSFTEFGVPDSFLLDHGVPWWSPSNAHGLTRLTVFLLEQDIRLIYCGFAHPQTQGKVERFHRTLGRRLRQWGVPTSLAGFRRALDRFRIEYNTIRPHEGLGDQPPAAVYAPATRPFRKVPIPFAYPTAYERFRLNRSGELHFDRRRFYISDALAHREVGCLLIGDQLLVKFRHMPVRAIDLVSGHTSRMLDHIRP